MSHAECARIIPAAPVPPATDSWGGRQGGPDSSPWLPSNRVSFVRSAFWGPGIASSLSLSTRRFTSVPDAR
jgi:hypothetical protein